MVDKSIVVDGLACGIEGVFGRKCKVRDCTQISSSVWRSGDPFFEFYMALKSAAPEH